MDGVVGERGREREVLGLDDELWQMEAGARVAGDDERITRSVAVVGGRATTSKLEITVGGVRLPGLKLPRGESIVCNKIKKVHPQPELLLIFDVFFFPLFLLDFTKTSQSSSISLFSPCRCHVFPLISQIRIFSLVPAKPTKSISVFFHTELGR
ncbi:hypothetical protein L2E82_14390 [Cichorium intybus]|uniref:Uncharacterized protein n=1 Tax=Cichorium intybus TaxID=13427 RepID=A0ACB9F0H3_CICIN|nr:hypothetical protein L2E82_14390 [Cichorium intybus]